MDESGEQGHIFAGYQRQVDVGKSRRLGFSRIHHDQLHPTAL
jgi:hypothetical protein